MIAAKAQELTSLIDHWAELRAHLDKLDAFLGRKDKLVHLVGTLRPLTAATLELRRRKIAAIHLEDRLSGVHSQLRRVQTVFGEQREGFIEARRSGFADFERTVNALSSYLEKEVREAWRAYTKTQTQPLDPELLRVLDSIPVYSASVGRLQALDQLMIKLRDSLPSEDVCERFEQAVAERSGIWRDLGGDGFSSEIMEFLRKASSGGAELYELTPDVRNWITNHGLRTSFRITMASRART